MDIWRDFPGPNVAYVLELYDRYRQNPEAVDTATRAESRTRRGVPSRVARKMKYH